MRNYVLTVQQPGLKNLADELLDNGRNVFLMKHYCSNLITMVGFIQKFLKTVHASPAEEIAQFNLDNVRKRASPKELIHKMDLMLG